MTTQTKKIFVGSSGEMYPVAETLAAYFNREQNLSAIPWKDALEDCRDSTFDCLLQAAERFDFAVFVYGPDDFVESRGRGLLGPRENVVFEHGIFSGAMGRHRVWYLLPKGYEVKVSTDLLGHRYVTFVGLKQEGGAWNVDAPSMAGACSLLKRQVMQQLTAEVVVDRFVAAQAELHAALNQLARVTYLGEFPDFLKFIVSRLGEAAKHVRISCDALLYGHFSAYQDFLAYERALKELKRSGQVSVKLIVHDEAGSKKMRRLQFGDDSDDSRANESWKKLMEDKRFVHNLDELRKRNGLGMANLKEFFDAVLMLEQQNITSFNKDVVDELWRSPGVLPLNFWLIDESQAVFSFAAQGLTAAEHAFHTGDPALLRTLAGMWNHRIIEGASRVRS